jgi:hypothetical protein
MYKFVELLADVVEANILIVFVGIFTVRGRIEKQWKQMLGFAVAMGAICFLLDQIVLVSWGKTIAMLVLYVFVCTKVHHLDMRKSLLMVVSYITLATIFEFLVIFLLHCILGVAVSQFMELGIERVTAMIVSKILEIFTLCLIYRISSNQVLAVISKTVTVMVMCICVAVTFMTVFFMSNYVMGSYVEISVLFYLVISLSVVLFVMYFMFFAVTDLDRQQKLKMMQLQNTMLQKSLEETKQSYTYWERRIHDYKNVVLCLDSMMENNDYVSVCKYLKREISHLQKSHHTVNSGNTLVDSLLNAKWLVADNNEIFFSVQGKVEKHLPIPEIAFGRLLGNLIDNAIEGAKCCKCESYVEVVLFQTEYYLSLVISNSSIEKKIDFWNSSKKDKKLHGIGLNSVRDIVEEYEGCFEVCQIRNRVVATVELFATEDFG